MDSKVQKSDSGSDLILRSVEGGVATLTLNRPTARNALSRPLMADFQANLDEIAENEEIKVVVIAGMGQAFCAGHDLKEIRSNNRREIFDGLLAQCSTLMTSIVRLPKPVIARVHGIATAAGCQLVASCDMAIASENATFATPGVNIGLFCSTPMVAVSRAVPRKQTMEMLLTGEEISANTAKDFGLVNKVVPAKELELVTSDLASKIASKSPLTLRVGKEAFYRQLEMDLDSAYRYTSAVMAQNMMAADAQEGIDAFMQKRDPVWKGA
jgi:enoyl-CoA hydratase/carnithine racemase